MLLRENVNQLPDERCTDCGSLLVRIEVAESCDRHLERLPKPIPPGRSSEIMLESSNVWRVSPKLRQRQSKLARHLRLPLPMFPFAALPMWAAHYIRQGHASGDPKTKAFHDSKSPSKACRTALSRGSQPQCPVVSPIHVRIS